MTEAFLRLSISFDFVPMMFFIPSTVIPRSAAKLFTISAISMRSGGSAVLPVYTKADPPRKSRARDDSAIEGPFEFGIEFGIRK